MPTCQSISFRGAVLSLAAAIRVNKSALKWNSNPDLDLDTHFLRIWIQSKYLNLNSKCEIKKNVIDIILIWREKTIINPDMQTYNDQDQDS